MQREILAGVGVPDRHANSLLVQQEDIAVGALWRALHSHRSFPQPFKYPVKQSTEVCHNGNSRKQMGAAACYGAFAMFTDKYLLCKAGQREITGPM